MQEVTKHYNRCKSMVYVSKEPIYLGYHKNRELAARVRDLYIIKNCKMNFERTSEDIDFRSNKRSRFN